MDKSPSKKSGKRGVCPPPPPPPQKKKEKKTTTEKLQLNKMYNVKMELVVLGREEYRFYSYLIRGTLTKPQKEKKKHTLIFFLIVVIRNTRRRKHSQSTALSTETQLSSAGFFLPFPFSFLPLTGLVSYVPVFVFEIPCTLSAHHKSLLCL